MKDKYYGSVEQTVVASEIDRHVEAVTIKGYTIDENLFDDNARRQAGARKSNP